MEERLKDLSQKNIVLKEALRKFKGKKEGETNLNTLLQLERSGHQPITSIRPQLRNANDELLNNPPIWGWSWKKRG